MTASSNIPDSFNPEELKALLEDAPKDITDQPIDPDNISLDKLQEIINPLLDEALEQCPGPIVHKAMVMRILANLYDYHMGTAQRILADGSKAPWEIRFDAASGWTRDAGHLQCMMKIMSDIQCSENDPWLFE